MKSKKSKPKMSYGKNANVSETTLKGGGRPTHKSGKGKSRKSAY